MAADGQGEKKSIDEALEARVGQVLNEFLDRRAHGEQISEAELLAQHPDLAADLRAHLDLLHDLEPTRHALVELLDRGILTKSGDPRYPGQLGPYQVLGLLGRGGMGVVLKAYEERLNRPVALKLLRPELTSDKTALARFEREAKAAAGLQHPNIVAVHAIGEENGTHYIVMEFVSGPTLAALVRKEGPLPAERVRVLFGQILAGLKAAHEAGLVHRDIKSSNILLHGPEQLVKIADFGLARILSAETRMTMSGSIFGTPAYMSPEQARGEENIDHRTDLYSAGVVLYEMLTGRVPFRAAASSAVIHTILNMEPPAPRVLCTSADKHLSRLALRLMAKRREDRFASAAEALAALGQECQVHLPAKRRGRRRAAAAVVAVFALLALAWLGLRAVNNEDISEPDRTGASTGRITRATVDENLPTRILVEREGSAQLAAFFTFQESAQAIKGVDLVDRDGHGDVIIVAGTKKPVGQNCLFAFGSDATQLWQKNLSDAAQWPDCGPPTIWYTRALAKGNLDGEPGDEVVVVASDQGEYPTRVSVVSARNGEILKTFWHFGQLSGVRIVDGFFDGQRPAIVVWGINNKLQGFKTPKPDDRDHLATYRLVPAIMILDPEALGGLGPPRTQRLREKVDHPPCAYAFLDVPYSNMATYRSADDGRLLDPAPEQCVGISKVELGVYPPHESTGPWFSLTVSGEKAAGATITVDRNLNFHHAVPNLPEKVGREEDFWRKRWRVMVERGKYVSD